MTDVIKRNGKREPFDEEKVRNSIENTVKQAGEDVEKRKKLLDNTMADVNDLVKNKKEIGTEDIRNVVLDNFENEWVGDQVPMARVWRNYELEHKIIYHEKLD